MKCLIMSLVLALSFSKEEYFKVISSKDLSTVNTMLILLEKEKEGSDKKAYKGALLMKKAEFQKTPKDKLEIFKQGRIQLEHEIGLNSKSTEYRFLRLIIQENAPKLVKYQGNISEDASWIKKHYSSLNSEVKNAIISYAKISINLEL